MTDTPFKGGRGNKAPYMTTHLRIPVRLTSFIQTIVNTYKRAYQLNADDLVSRMEKSLAEYANDFSPEYKSTDKSKSFVSFEDHQIVLKRLDKLEALVEHQHIELEEAAWKLQVSSVYLKDALLLKPNAGGAIKKEIRKALPYLG